MALQKSGLELVAEGQAQYISQIAAADRATNTFAKGVTDSAAQVNAAADTIGKATANASGLYQDAAGKWRNASGQFASDAEKAAAGVVAATDKVGSQGGKGFEALENIARGALERVGHIAVDALGQAAQAAGQFAADSITAAGDFEASVNNLAAISGTALADAGFNFDDVSAKALQLGQDTAFSASESIEAMTNLVKGGVPVADVMNEATDATLALAAASGTDLASAADIVAKQLGVWGETGLTATAAADLLTQAANASTVGVEDLAQGLSQAGGTAKTAGVEYDDLVQTMALLAPGFSSASDAGTSLKTFLSRLVPSTKAATEEMMALGLATADGKSKFYDAEGSFIGMEAAAALLAKQTANLSEEQRLAAFNTIFGSDAIRAASAIANSGAEGFNAMGEAMAGAGTAAETAAIQNQGFNFAMDSLKGSVETLQIVIGSALLPILTQLINDYLIPGVGVVMQFAQALFGNTDALAALSPQMQGAVAGVQSFLAAAQPVAEFLIANWQPALAAVAGVIGAIVIPALVAMVAPFAPIIAAVGAAIAIGAALQGAWQSNFGGIQQATATAMTAVQGVITAVLGVVSEFWAAHGDEIVTFTGEAWGQIQEIVGTIAAIVATVVSTVFGGIATFIGEHGTEIQTVLSVAWNVIQTTIETVLNVIQGVVNTVLAVMQGDWKTAQEEIQGIVETLGEFLSEQFDNIKTLITELGPDLLGAATDVGNAIVDGIAGGISSAAGAIADAARDAAQSALDAAKRLLGIKSPSKVFADEVGAPVSEGLAEGILQGMPGVLSAIATLGDEAQQAALRSFEGIGDAAADLMDDALTGKLGILRAQQRGLGDLGKLQDELAELDEKRKWAYATPEEGAAVEAQYQQLAARLAKMQRLQAEAEREAEQIAAVDPEAGSQYLVLREQQIAKILDLENELSTATTASQRERAARMLQLEREAQSTELEQLRSDIKKRADALAGIGDGMAETGNAVVDGIVLGIQQRADALAEALGKVLGAALANAQKTMGIHSPSAVFAAMVGAPIAEGMAQGVMAAASIPVAATQAVAAMMAGSASMATVAAPATANSYSNASYSYGPSYSIDARGSTLNEAQIEGAFTRALYARTSRADRLARTGGGSG